VPRARPTAGEAHGQAASPAFRRYLVILFVFSLGCSSDAFLLLRARECGVALAVLPTLWAVFNVSRVVSAYFGGTLSDRVRRVPLVIAGWVVYAATYFAFGLAREPWHVWALFVFYGLYYGLTEPVEKALVRELVPETARGRAYGQYHFVVGIAAIPASLLTGALWETFGAATALNAGAVLALVAAVLLLAWARAETVHARG
jgi:MFS family permease